MTAKKSELQKAADRVREMQVAIEQTEKGLKEAAADYDRCKLALDNAERDLADNNSLLRAQNEKLERELATVRRLAWNDTAAKAAVAQCEKTDAGHQNKVLHVRNIGREY